MLLKPIEDDEIKAHLETLPEDGRDIFLLADGQVRLTALSATTMINRMRANHRTGLLETYVLGQGYIAGGLLASTVKGNDRIQLSIECGGPIKGLSIEAWASGAVRGFLVNNPIPLTKPLESLDTSLLYGPGFLTVTKLLEGSRTPFSGQIMLQHGNLANDLAQYFQESEQTPTLFYLSIKFDRSGRVWGAGGLFLQALPGCEDSTLESLQDASQFLGGLGEELSRGITTESYVRREFSAFSPVFLSHEEAYFDCQCSRDSFEHYLKGLPASEKEAIMNGEFPLVLECLNCSSDYYFDKPYLEKLFQEER